MFIELSYKYLPFCKQWPEWCGSLIQYLTWFHITSNLSGDFFPLFSCFPATHFVEI